MNNFRVRFMTHEPVDDICSKSVSHDFIMAGVDAGGVTDQIRLGYKTQSGVISIVDLGPIVPLVEPKNWTVELYTADPRSSNPHPVWRVRQVVAVEDYQAIEQVKAYYTALDHTEIELIGVYEGPYEEDKLHKPVRW